MYSMTHITMEKHKILDGEKLFRLYYLEMGSARSVKKVIKQLGDSAINPATGRVVTDMAIWFAIYRWAMDNLDASYDIISKAAYDEGVYYPKEQWVAKIEKIAKTCLRNSDKAYKKWQTKHNLSESPTSA